jgi:chaperonin GroES
VLIELSEEVKKGMAGKKLNPIGDRVVVKPEPEEQKTKSGIVLPDSAKEKPQEGTVVAVGTGRILDNGQKVPLDVKIGDKIIYSKYGGTEVKIDNEEYIILSEKDILAIRS